MRKEVIEVWGEKGQKENEKIVVKILPFIADGNTFSIHMQRPSCV
jgi:hypothetical protein